MVTFVTDSQCSCFVTKCSVIFQALCNVVLTHTPLRGINQENCKPTFRTFDKLQLLRYHMILAR